ncbi:DsrE family protein [Thalassoroseus pseudoceratinae]|uniref:DsrE family protein n=1 Tax=Thalassoroseus pseudoceratinae TaxID=2713176 RepID=UPI001F0DF432|nr:DsrE family protein [Thalassoroseus pseudoceratinae]
MKKVSSVFVFVTLLALGFATTLPGDSQEAPTIRQNQQQVVVHLSHFTDDLHRCFMALKIATLMKNGGADVTLFLDLEGVRLAERRQLLDMTWGSDSTPLAKHYENFAEAGGKVVLCPHCAKSARIGDIALKRHAEIGTEELLGQMLLNADKILDY